MEIEAQQLLEEAVEKILKQEDGVTVYRAAILPNGSNVDFLVEHRDGSIEIVECRTNRDNLGFVINRLNDYRSRLHEHYHYPNYIEAITTLAMPRREINATVVQKSKDKEIRLLPVDIDLPEQKRLNLSLKLNEEHDSDLVEWLKDVPSGKVQSILKDALRTYFRMQSNDTERVLKLIRDDLAQIKSELIKQKGE